MPPHIGNTLCLLCLIIKKVILTTHLHPVFDQIQWLHKHSCTHTENKISLLMSPNKRISGKGFQERHVQAEVPLCHKQQQKRNLNQLSSLLSTSGVCVMVDFITNTRISFHLHLHLLSRQKSHQL